MSELPQDNVFELPVPPDGKVGDAELDRVIDHARRFGRCLFRVAGGNIITLTLHDEDKLRLES